ncbi:MAG: hypothetical protein ABH812_01640 [bacterium]
MFSDKYSIYLGTESDTVFTGFIADANLYLILKIDIGLTKELGRETLKDISESIKTLNIQSLDDFENFLSSKWKGHNFPTEFSYAAGYIYDKTLYLKTNLNGQVFIKKRGSFAKIIDGENKASGKVEDGDFIVFANKEFTKIIGGEENLEKIFDHRSPQEILEDITPNLKSQNDEGSIAIFLNLEEKKEQNVNIESVDKQEKAPLTLPKSSVIRDKYLNLTNYFSSKFNNKFSKKPITLILVLILASFLVWSLFLGNSRKAIKEESLIKEKLLQAEEVYSINLPRAMALLGDAKKDLSDLKNRSNNKKSKQIIELETLIKEYESRILKSEEKEYSEFYDFSVENKNVNITKIYKFEDKLATLDPSLGVIYIISLSEKSIDSRKSAIIKTSKAVALYENITFFLKNDGAYSITEENKAKKVINSDGWGSVKDISAYAGNIYVLDTSKSDVFKYLPIENGFSSKKSYFASSQDINLDSANSISVDGSIFIGFQESIVKFTSGLRDGFSTSYPKEDIKISRIFTDQNSKNVYAWSKTDGTIYILSKSGGYESQVKSSILKKVSDFVVYNNSIFASQGSKIYKINLE